MTLNLDGQKKHTTRMDKLLIGHAMHALVSQLKSKFYDKVKEYSLDHIICLDESVVQLTCIETIHDVT